MGLQVHGRQNCAVLQLVPKLGSLGSRTAGYHGVAPLLAGEMLSLVVKARLRHCRWLLPGWRLAYTLSLQDCSQRRKKCAQCVFQGVNISDVYACPRSVSAASLLIKNCSNQARGLLCEAEEPKLFVNSVQIQWVFFTQARNGYVSFLHFETNLISFLECEMIIVLL